MPDRAPRSFDPDVSADALVQSLARERRALVASHRALRRAVDVAED